MRLTTNFDFQTGGVLDSEVTAAMKSFQEQNDSPTSLHHRGIRAREALRIARQQLAQLIGARSPEELFFASSGSEALSLAVNGFLAARPEKGNLILSATEQSAVFRLGSTLQRQGYHLDLVPVDSKGRLDILTLASKITPQTGLVCVHWANHEVGAIQSIPEISILCSERGVPLFIDASAALGWVPMDFKMMELSLVSMDALSLGGPQGVGIAYVRAGTPFESFVSETRHELGLLGGMEYMGGIVGAGVAATLCHRQGAGRGERARQQQKFILNEIRKCIPDTHLIGPEPGVDRLPNHLSIATPGADGEALALKLDLKGFTVGTGPLCAPKKDQPSHVLRALGVPEEYIRSNLLLTWGMECESEILENLIREYSKCVAQLRAMNINSTG